MRVRVLFFGQLKDIVGSPEEEAEVDDGSRVEDLFARYHRRFPRLAEMRPSMAASVNQEFAAWEARLWPGDEVAFLPPVSGGEQENVAIAAAADVYELVRAPIRTEEIVAALKAPQDGAVVVFEGIVRNHSGKRATLYLDYEAYELMALKQLRALGDALRRQFAIHRIALVHRLGRLQIGETSVLIAISSAHRLAAFDACRYAIDALKRSVPIWKKEYFAGAAEWAAGEIPQQSFAGQNESESK